MSLIVVRGDRVPGVEDEAIHWLLTMRCHLHDSGHYQWARVAGNFAVPVIIEFWKGERPDLAERPDMIWYSATRYTTLY